MANPRRSVFRPCIDLHNGQVKQIVGGTLSDNTPDTLKINFVAEQSACEFATIYRKRKLTGGHEALAAWPGGLQIGGGISGENAQVWLDAGASKVIVTSYLFPKGVFSLERLQSLSKTIGKERLVVDVSCRRRGDKWLVAMNKWQDITDMEVSKENLDMLAEYCSEFLVHAADVEGLCQGIDGELVKKLGEWVSIPTTYAGGAKDISDLDLVNTLSGGKVDLTFGSSLDIFGGRVSFEKLVEKNTLLS
ncbi:N--5 [Coprinellus micaceus]|uniref:1-(5-phosphoribosyl)-5-[(5-phosphoribosylamino)methylideneamino] imidazole-4-carboxamide isomerase n=1 Tax=Coprinellus micaceus TaxID=71717 RepID=A0A4Y7TNR5_COPMI|nr:N--5 [Coprinellus micaceus]